MAAGMTGLQQRIVTAIVLVAVLLATLFLLPPIAPVALLGSFLLVGAWEWSGFFLPNLWKRLAYVALLAAGAVAGTSIADTNAANAILLLAAFWWLGVIVWLFRGATEFGAGFCFVAGCMGLLPAWIAVMRLFDCGNGSWLFVWVVAIVAAADIGAFFTGKALGRVKLAPHISPGKTREGLVGGVVAAAVAAAVGAILAGASPVFFAAAGVVMALVSVAGDLSVSVWKRRAGLKDSGRLLPGHGGIMDRVDSLVAVLPLFALLLFVGGRATEGTCRLY